LSAYSRFLLSFVLVFSCHSLVAKLGRPNPDSDGTRRDNASPRVPIDLGVIDLVDGTASGNALVFGEQPPRLPESLNTVMSEHEYGHAQMSGLELEFDGEDV
jgi:hypothetical protein